MLNILKIRQERKARNLKMQETAEAWFRQIQARIRLPIFYTQYGIPDTFYGRYELLALHLVIVMEACRHQLPEEFASEINQALFTYSFRQVERSLRELGVGDMGVPKRMRRLMKGFNGRLQALSTIGMADDHEISDFLQRNLLGNADVPLGEILPNLTAYVQLCRQEIICSPQTAEIVFPPLQNLSFSYKD